MQLFGGTVLRQRDFLLLCIVAVAIWTTLNNAGISYSLEPSWYLDQRKYTSPSSSSSSSIPPIVTDLDGDGRQEIVLITRDMQLKVISAEAPNNDHSEIYIPEELYSARLSALNVQKGKKPVAMKTGYVSPYDSVKERTQVIVVVREDWSVSCYDHNLHLLWEKAVAHKTHEMDVMTDTFAIDEVAVHIAPISITQGSTGCIIIGASMALRDPDHGIKVENDASDSSNHAQSGDKLHPEMHARSMLEHFSVYCLNAENGHVLWVHDGLEMNPQESFVKSLPMNALKLDRRDLQVHVHHAPGLSDWTIFRQSLISQLPHMWTSSSDTKLSMAHFERRHVGAKSVSIGAGNKATEGRRNDAVTGKTDSNSNKRAAGRLVSGAGRFTGIETPPLPSNAVLPHDASEHIEHPNVLVAHTKHGLEVIALKTGVPMTSLALMAGRTYADCDGDGVVDSILVVEHKDDALLHGYSSPHASGELQVCSMVVISGLPAAQELFNGTLCSSRHSLSDPISSKRPRGRASVPESIQAAPALILRTLDPRTMVESKQRDVILAIHSGIVTSYSGSGTFKWQLKGAPMWEATEKGVRNGGIAVQYDHDAQRVQQGNSHDTLYSNILVIGQAAISLISRDGSFLSTADLPNPAIAAPTLGDFDNDGVIDVIIVTDDSILGYRLEITASSRGLLVALICLSSIAAVVFLANIRVEGVEAEGEPGKVSVAAKKSVLSIVRSTDDYHLD